jgi:hypothetical protein
MVSPEPIQSSRRPWDYRAECVPTLSRRFAARLVNDSTVRRQLRCLEEQLDGTGLPN